MSLLNRKTLSAVLILLTGWLFYQGYKVHAQRQESLAQVQDLESRVEDLKRNNEFLASSSDYFGSDAYLERQARLKLNYKLPDEQVAFVYQDKNSQTTPAAVPFAEQLKKMSNWKKWWYYLLGY